MEREGFEPTKIFRSSDLQSATFGHSVIFPFIDILYDSILSYSLDSILSYSLRLYIIIFFEKNKKKQNC